MKTAKTKSYIPLIALFVVAMVFLGVIGQPPTF